MKADYKNWIPKGMIAALSAVCGLGAAALGAGTVWSVAACRAFSYEGTRQLSKRIVEGVAEAVTSNYVYHNIPSRDRQKLLLETLRVLKKGGAFAIHDIMTPSRYGDMEAFAESLRKKGYESAELIDTSHGLFMSPGEAKWLGLNGSALLTGRK